MGSEPHATTAKGISRRGVLKAGLLGTAITVLAATGLALRRTVLRPTPASELHVLDAGQYAVLTAIAERLCPASGDGAPGATALDIAARVDEDLAASDVELQEAVRLLLDVFENALTGALFGERLAPFTQLDPEAQDRVLQQWRASSVMFRRSAYAALDGIVSSTYFSDPRTWARIGYGGPPSPALLRVGFAMNLVDYDRLRATKD